MANTAIEIEWTSTALESLKSIGSQDTQRKIASKIDSLRSTSTPEQLGKPLVDELKGLLRLSYARYRILYRVRHPDHPNGRLRVVVQVILVGIRKEGDKRDVYRLAQRLRRRGKL